jgi:hypothetical protein
VLWIWGVVYRRQRQFLVDLRILGSRKDRNSCRIKPVTSTCRTVQLLGVRSGANEVSVLVDYRSPGDTAVLPGDGNRLFVTLWWSDLQGPKNPRIWNGCFDPWSCDNSLYRNVGSQSYSYAAVLCRTYPLPQSPDEPLFCMLVLLPHT